jgi:hypothetical protein
MKPRQEEGRPTTAFLLGIAIALSMLVALVMTGANASSATGPSMIGLDMTSATTSAADGVATCTEVKAGDSFDADIFVANVEQLLAWELRVDFNPEVVSLESADYNFFLTQGGGGILGRTMDEEKAGRWFLAAAETSHANSGSGVLARLHLVALKDGTSPLTIASSPAFYGPRLQATGGTAFGDSNGDGIYDGEITGGNIAVGRRCTASTPIITPGPIPNTPTPKPTGKTPAPTAPSRTPVASGSPAPTTGGNDGSDGGDGSDGSNGSTGNDATTAPTDGEGAPVPTQFVIDAPLAPLPDGGEDEPGDSASEEEGTPGDDESSSGEPAKNADDGGGSSGLILAILGALAALAAIVGGTFLVMRASNKA